MSLNKAPKNNVFYRNQNWHYPKIKKGEGIYLIDENGNRYIDACCGSAVSNIGHGNKEIAQYTKEHMERIAFTHLSRWTVDSIEKCAKMVVNWMPTSLDHVYFVSGGSEATETAIKMARQYFVERDGQNTSKSKIISKWTSYHGNTLGALSMTGITGRRKYFDGMLVNFPKIPQFYHYRNVWGTKTLEETSVKAAEEIERCILANGPENIAAFISEPVVGSAAPGIHPTPTYFEIAREICDKYDILMISDEVMAGFGRTGKNLGIDHYNVKPDIVATGKGMSCGYTPMGATVANKKIFDTIMVQGSGHFVNGHTYAGNPLSCGISAKVLEIIERENYVENCRLQGKYFMEKLQNLYNYPIVGEIRGKGLMIGIEFVKNQDTKEAFGSMENIKNKVTFKGLDNGIVLYPGGGSVDGVRGDHILIAPPFNITKEEIDDLYSKLEKSIKETCNDIR